MRCISPVFVRKSFQFVPCGKCNFCLQKRRADWTFRIHQESRHCRGALFITLTYDGWNVPVLRDEHYAVRKIYPYVLSLDKPDFQLFMKRLRKAIEPARIRYYLVGEYGEEFERPHYHIILFDLPLGMEWHLEKLWGKGIVHVGQVSMASIHYVTKYIINKNKDYGGRAPPFALMSRGGKNGHGIGFNYVQSHYKWHRNAKRNYTEVNGFKAALPRYYKEKFFGSVERAKLALESLEIGENEYRKAVEKLAKFHPDAESYYYERLLFLHDAIEKNSFKIKSKF